MSASTSRRAERLLEQADHKAEAERILAEPAYGLAEGNDPHGAALAHATLALVEEQRVADLIAYRDQVPASDLALRASLDKQIREGLGL